MQRMSEPVSSEFLIPNSHLKNGENKGYEGEWDYQGHSAGNIAMMKLDKIPVFMELMTQWGR